MKKIITLLFFIGLSFSLKAQLNIKASEGLLQRIIPSHVTQFVIQSLPKSNDSKDYFTIESKNKKVVLSGNNGVSIASALYCYLNEYCHCQITWNGTNLSLPKILPVVSSKVKRATPYEHRYYLNYCTFNYSMSWWDWKRWEKEIDWMALHGINMPLAITGEEYTWRQVYKEMGFTDEELNGFFTGPSYFSWFWMGNIDGWGGPLPYSWMKGHKILEQQIVQRERELGMKPILPAFTGHVPAAFKERFPGAKLKQTNWRNGFADTYILDSEDPMFAKIGKRFLEVQTGLYGTDHYYSADTFNENEPPSDDPAFLSMLSKRVYEGMRNADKDAVWVMQGWLFYSDRKFWKSPQIKALLDAVPNDHMLLLDLAAEIEPVWKRTDAFYGKPWIWNMLNNFGGNTNLFGHLEDVAIEPAKALNSPLSGKMKGIGLTMEAIEQNPVLYELMMQHTWNNQPIDVDYWLQTYILNRYGNVNTHAIQAWQILKKTVYNGKVIRDGAESIITGRPTCDSVAIWTRTKLNYPAIQLLPAWDHFIQAIDSCKSSDGFQYDLVDITRQVLANYALPLQRKWVEAYQHKNREDFEKYSSRFIELIDDLDTLLATRKDFLLGPWISDATKWGENETEKALYERNARNLITLWGGANSPLHEYSCRQWSGLLSDFYKPRWLQFFQKIDLALSTGKELDNVEFAKEIKAWEWQWVNTQKQFPVTPQGNPIEKSKMLYSKYRSVIQSVYHN
ncbi:MAG: alpha-N-acetylglucosaminidase [Bacteroidetes bacterium]|nr:alpha-N-acetylglucosaminidase [Bacteroidota bacterium]